MDPKPTTTDSDTLQHLSKKRRTTSNQTAKHSDFIRSMRIALPLLALLIITLVFSWNSFQNPNIEPLEATTETTMRHTDISRNELLNPRFESMDKDNQPFMVTADRALQGTGENDLLLLENTLADIALNQGQWIAVRADQAAYRQTAQRILLQDNVELFYDQGYVMKTEELDLDIDKGLASTDRSVFISGPSGTLDAKGLKANTEEEALIFIGPAKLVLFQDNQTATGDISP